MFISGVHNRQQTDALRNLIANGLEGASLRLRILRNQQWILKLPMNCLRREGRIILSRADFIQRVMDEQKGARRHQRRNINKQLVAKESALLREIAKDIDQEEQEGKQCEKEVVRELCGAAKDPIFVNPLYKTFEVHGFSLMKTDYLTRVPVRLQRVFLRKSTMGVISVDGALSSYDQ